MGESSSRSPRRLCVSQLLANHCYRVSRCSTRNPSDYSDITRVLFEGVHARLGTPAEFDTALVPPTRGGTRGVLVRPLAHCRLTSFGCFALR